ncbi:MAG: dethiobiotin synthase [Dorea sp.]|nr:dethiobiotin synthase [Dorea sp.]
MSKQVFVTGTGTDVGKTYVTGLIVKKLQESGLHPGYYKAAVSGNERDLAGNLIPGDAKFVKEMAGLSQTLEEMCPYLYEVAYSPHLASRVEGNPVKKSVVLEGLARVADNYDYVTMEGSGGILCPIDYDHERLMLWELVKELKMPCVIVANAGLGTINDVGLTTFFMREKGIPIAGVIFNHFHPGNVMEEDNIRMCKELFSIPVIACVKDGDRELDVDTELLKSLYREC